MDFFPSALWISCCNMNRCAEFLLDKQELALDRIAEAGPDGTTALTQMFANIAKKKELSSYIEKFIVLFTERSRFCVKDVIEASIIFGSVNIFEKFNQFITEYDTRNLTKLAIQCEDVNILQIIFDTHPDLKESFGNLAKKSHSRPILQLFGKSFKPSNQSQLMRMSQKYPKFNENLEKIIEPLPWYVKEVNIDKHIKPLLKEEFCGLVACYQEESGEDKPSSMPISKWKRSPCLKAHGR